MFFASKNSSNIPKNDPPQNPCPMDEESADQSYIRIPQSWTAYFHISFILNNKQ